MERFQMNSISPCLPQTDARAASSLTGSALKVTKTASAPWQAFLSSLLSSHLSVPCCLSRSSGRGKRGRDKRVVSWKMEEERETETEGARERVQFSLSAQQKSLSNEVLFQHKHWKSTFHTSFIGFYNLWNLDTIQIVYCYDTIMLLNLITN